MSYIRRAFGLAQRGATTAEQSQAKMANALRDVTDSTESSKQTSKILLESHKELRKAVHSFEPFIEAERLLKDGPRFNGVKLRR